MIGVDLVHLPELARVLQRRPRFKERVFTEAERAYCDARPDPLPHYAARFAAKEAAVKILRRNPGWQNMEVERAGDGAPSMAVRGSNASYSLSISHSGDYAAAVVFQISGERSEKAPAPRARPASAGNDSSSRP